MTLPPSAKCVLRELEFADAALSRGALADNTRLSYSTVCDGVRDLREAGLIEPVPDGEMRFRLVDDYETRNPVCS